MAVILVEMASGNGGFSEIPPTGNPAVDAALQRLQMRSDSRFRDIEDAMVVQAHLEKRMSERIKEHAAFIERHEILMAEFDDKLNALIDIVRRRESDSAHD